MELDALKVNHAGLDQVADDLMRVVLRIDARMGRLDHELAPLRSSWIGEAQRAYAVSKRRWDAAIGEMRDLLRSTSAQVSSANADYRAADARGARAFDI
ncbi:MAG TPA: WXG100 family type VII secretion target [Nocardioides sp.]|jgi:WXG100 family type VII secretion target|uniref:WXG100 family type VII secretion target n=1 Tax=Nocardioides sp. TaxID=35761 RepID=UPI002E314EFD|nr:WXG100 family type VII secretion target [Nocardioides sp.]HEX3929649.1 WXG100 family type VII secretion target [Nocardioides sp.]